MQVFNQDAAKNRSSNSIVFICGHYKGIDQRVRNEIVTDEYSLVIM